MNSSEPTHDRYARQPETSAVSFVENVCLPYLLKAQNPDGGWGFSMGLESRVEPTSWALLALHEFSADPSGEPAVSSGYNFLESSQLPDGSWPSAPGQTVGCWVTSLACWALLARGSAGESLARGIHWLAEVEPGDAKLLRRVVRGAVRLISKRSVNSQSESLWGWSWTEGTASWVEPTAQALLVLRMAGPESPLRDAAQRQEMARKMLYDRMCPGGGWNCGNPMVYGVAGEPLVGPTVWALLALRAHTARKENQMSLDWLANNWMKIESPASLALANIALAAYGKQIAGIREALTELYSRGDFAATVPVAAWTALALGEKMNWLDLTMAPKAS